MTGSSPDSIRAAIDNYLGLLDGEPKTEQRELRKLTLALDRLVSEYQKTEDVDAIDEEADAPSTDYESPYRQAGASYPTLGYYTHIVPDKGMNVEPALADAIDDLTDIARDLHEVLWHLDRGRVTDAIWHFRFNYQIHWGVHLHNLRTYLHSAAIEAR